MYWCQSLSIFWRLIQLRALSQHLIRTNFSYKWEYSLLSMVNCSLWAEAVTTMLFKELSLLVIIVNGSSQDVKSTWIREITYESFSSADLVSGEMLGTYRRLWISTTRASLDGTKILWSGEINDVLILFSDTSELIGSKRFWLRKVNLTWYWKKLCQMSQWCLDVC